jgi:hypothetical protein
MKVGDHEYDTSQAINLLTGIGQTAGSAYKMATPKHEQVRVC